MRIIDFPDKLLNNEYRSIVSNKESFFFITKNETENKKIFFYHRIHIISSLLQTYGAAAAGVVPKILIEDISFGVDTAIPCGLVINELVSNSLKHAFPEGRGEIEISIKKSENRDADDYDFRLSVKDNGTGIPEGINIRETKSLGLQLVTILAEHQLRGKIEIGRSDGTEFNIFFNELKYKKRI